MSNKVTPEHIGRRILFTDGLTGSDRVEATVLELSPSGENVKLRHASGVETWEENDGWDCRVLEVLP